MEGAAWMHWEAVETRETGLETFTGGGGEHVSAPDGLENHSDGHPSETEQLSTSDVHLSSHNSQHCSQDLSTAALWRTAACMTLMDCTDTETGCEACLPFLPHYA